MSIDQYSRVIDEWCNATGMSPWRTDEDMNVVIGDTTWGFIYDSIGTPDTLHVFGDLNIVDSVELNRRMLELNLSIDSHPGGTFALHPETSSMVYRLELPLTPGLDGAELPARLTALLGAARAQLFS
jgi:hypothetical protein